MSEYKIKVHTHSPDAARNLLNGQDLLSLLRSEIEDITNKMQKKQFAPADSIFADLIETDFDLDDDSIKNWLNLGGLPEVKKFRNSTIAFLLKLLENISLKVMNLITEKLWIFLRMNLNFLLHQQILE